jgi:hypothetical protein
VGLFRPVRGGGLDHVPALGMGRQAGLGQARESYADARMRSSSRAHSRSWPQCAAPPFTR